MNKRKTFRVGFSCLLMVLSFVSVNSNYMFAGKNISVQENDTVYAVADKQPQFPGGETARNEFMKQNVHYPEEAQRNHQGGKVIVQFVVSSTGKVQNVKVVKSIAPSLDQEALRVINSFPQWIPAELNGNKVSMYQLMPVAFRYAPIENSAADWQVSDSTLIVIDSLKMPLKFNLNVINPEAIDTGTVYKPFPLENKNKLISQFGPLARNGVILIKTSKITNFVSDTTSYKPGDENYIYKKADKMPQYPGGESVLMNYIGKNLKYPVIAQENAIQGKVVIRFVIDRTGKVKLPTVIRSIDPLLDNEAMRIIKSLTDFIPGEKNGQKVNVYMTLPIGFKLEETRSRSYREDYGVDTKKLLVVLDGNKLPIGFNRNWLNLENLTSYRLLSPGNEKEKELLVNRYGNEGKYGVFEIKSFNNILNKSKYEYPKDSMGNRIYHVIEVMPVFPGGEKELMKFVAENLKYPEASKAKNIQGRVIVRFVVNSAGKIEKSELVRSLNSECDKEALRIVSLFPTWTPGKQNGVNVSVFYTLPIRFHF
jgi:TonB family protein